MLPGLKAYLKNILPARVYRFLLLFRNMQDFRSIGAFLVSDIPNMSLSGKLRIVRRIFSISLNIDSPHAQDEVLAFMRTILTLPPEGKGVLVEAGCFKGSSTAKFSLAADIAGRELVVFDSFEGIPENEEQHEKNIFGGRAGFKKGSYSGALEEVKGNVARFGKIDRCRFIPGWFDKTMPGFKETISAVYLDVDLASSTRTCLKYLYPLLENGGVLYSQDGHLPLVIQVFDDDKFWMDEVGCEKPRISGLGVKKLIKIIKGA